MLVALSLGNGGPEFACLAEALYSYISNGMHSTTAIPDLSILPDEEIKGNLQEVSPYIFIAYIGI